MQNGMFSDTGILYTMTTKNDHPDYPFGRVPRTLVIGVGPFNENSKLINTIT